MKQSNCGEGWNQQLNPPSGEVNLKTFDELAYTLSALNNQGKELILVSSGAIGGGLK